MYIYCITNKIDGRKYVGKCVRPSNKSENYYGSGTYIRSSIKEHGIENFTKEILEDNVTDGMLCEREVFWIKELNTRHPVGYNLTDGGDGANNISDETKKKISETMKKVAVFSEEFLQQQKQDKKGQNHPMYGTRATEETKKKMSEYHKANPVKFWLGKKQPIEVTEKIAAKNRGRKHNQNFIDGMTGENNPFYGKTHSEETKEKIRDGQINKTPEQKLEKYIKFYISRFGVEPSQEQKDNRLDIYTKQKGEG